MDFLEIFNYENIANISLIGIVILFWLIVNNWINKNLNDFLKKRDWLISGREKNLKQLAKNILFIISCIWGFQLKIKTF